MSDFVSATVYFPEPVITGVVVELIGPRGATGEDGADGANGNDGLDGETGASAFEIAVSNGFSGTVEDWLASLHGEKGDTGETGSTGASAYAAYLATTSDNPPLSEAAWAASRVEWAQVTNKPTTFTPAAHTHAASEISDSGATGRAVVQAATQAAASMALACPRLLGANCVTVTAPADTATNTLKSISIPGGSMGPNGILRIVVSWRVKLTNTATVQLKFGTAVLKSVANISGQNMVNCYEIIIANQNSESSQILSMVSSNGTAAYGSIANSDSTGGTGGGGAIGLGQNTANTLSLSITAQKTTGSDLVYADMLLAEVIHSN